MRGKGTLRAATPGRPGLSKSGKPMVAYRLDRALRRGERFFETGADKRDEDAGRVRGLQTAQLAKRDRRRAERLIRRLLQGVETGVPYPTLASSLYVREQRIPIIGAVWRLHDELAPVRRVVCTVIPRGFSLTEEELARFDVRKSREALRGDLKRAGSAHASGCLIMFLHGEYDPNTGRFQLHWHGWAAGEMIGVLQRLRKQKKYDSSEQARATDTDGVRNRVRISRKPIRNAAYRLSYLLQSFWPGRRTGDLAELETGKRGRYRVRAKHRIPEPYHSQYLLWLDQWRIEDISLLMGMSVAGGRLRLNNARVSSINRRR